jgi:type II secretory pathway pseudopilin PulG
MIMNRLFCILIAIILALGFIGCKQKGSVSDKARIQQADRAIIFVRNAIEEYYTDHNTYPPDGANLEEVLMPYMPKTATSGDSITKWEKEIKPAFSEGPYYSTQNPKINFFVKARAKDLNGTWVSVRPSIIREEEVEDKDKKKGKK